MLEMGPLLSAGALESELEVSSRRCRREREGKALAE